MNDKQNEERRTRSQTTVTVCSSDTFYVPPGRHHHHYRTRSYSVNDQYGDDGELPHDWLEQEATYAQRVNDVREYFLCRSRNSANTQGSVADVEDNDVDDVVLVDNGDDDAVTLEKLEKSHRKLTTSLTLTVSPPVLATVVTSDNEDDDDDESSLLVDVPDDTFFLPMTRNRSEEYTGGTSSDNYEGDDVSGVNYLVNPTAAPSQIDVSVLRINTENIVTRERGRLAHGRPTAQSVVSEGHLVAMQDEVPMEIGVLDDLVATTTDDDESLNDGGNCSGGDNDEQVAEIPPHILRHLSTLDDLVNMVGTTDRDNVFVRQAFLLTFPYHTSGHRVLNKLMKRLSLSPFHGVSTMDDMTDVVVAPSIATTPTGASSTTSASSPRSPHRRMWSWDTVNSSSNTASLSATHPLTMWRAGILRLFGVIKSWLQNFPEDFSALMTDKLSEFLGSYPPHEWQDEAQQFGVQLDTKSLQAVARALLNTLQNKPDSNEFHWRSGDFKWPCSPAHNWIMARMFRVGEHILKLNSSCQIALHLTMLTRERFRNLRPRHFINDANGRDLGAYQMKLSNQISLWVATEILCCEDDNAMVEMFRMFVKIAHECMKQRNFNAVIEILVGLKLQPIFRLKFEKQLSSRLHEWFVQMSRMVDASNNYKVYRDALFEARAQRLESLPYLGIMLKDVQSLRETGIRYNKRRLFFKKCCHIARLIYDTITCGVVDDEPITSEQNFTLVQYRLAIWYAMDYDKLMARSYAVKPRKIPQMASQ